MKTNNTQPKQARPVAETTTASGINNSAFAMALQQAKEKAQQKAVKGQQKATNANATPLKEQGQKQEHKTENQGKTKTKIGYKLNPLCLTMTQFNRQFKLMKDSNRHCLENFPDCFHHKEKTADECRELSRRLQQGKYLIREFTQGRELTDEQIAILSEFRQALGYLCYKLDDIADDVTKLKIERIENAKSDIQNQA